MPCPPHVLLSEEALKEFEKGLQSATEEKLALRRARLERSLMAMVYELQSLSAALRMHDAFAREARGVLPLLEELGDESVVRYRDRYERLMHKYGELGRPKRLRTAEDQSYLRDIRQFSQDLLAYVEHRYPAKLGGGVPWNNEVEK
jgi:hypothetical protein